MPTQATWGALVRRIRWRTVPEGRAVIMVLSLESPSPLSQRGRLVEVILTPKRVRQLIADLTQEAERIEKENMTAADLKTLERRTVRGGQPLGL